MVIPDRVWDELTPGQQRLLSEALRPSEAKLALYPELVVALKDILENGFHYRVRARECGGSEGGCLLCRGREAAEAVLTKAKAIEKE